MPFISKMKLFSLFLLIPAISATAQDTIGFARRFTERSKLQRAVHAAVHCPGFVREAVREDEVFERGVPRTEISTTVELPVYENVADSSAGLGNEESSRRSPYLRERAWKGKWRGSKYEYGRGERRVNRYPQRQEDTSTLKAAVETNGTEKGDAFTLSRKRSHTRRLSSVDMETGELDEDEAEDVLFYLLNNEDPEEDEANKNMNNPAAEVDTV